MGEFLKVFPDTKFVAEPGRFFIARSSTIVTQVIGKKRVDTSEGIKWFYSLNEGHYGLFNGIFVEEPNKIPRHFKEEGQKFLSRFYGPSCDPTDLILNTNIEELEIEDLVYFVNSGAYIKVLASKFNGFFQRDEVIIWREDSLGGDCHI